jgi:hypothetical protein
MQDQALRLTITGAGNTIEFTHTYNGWTWMPGSTGLEMIPRSVRSRSGAADGGVVLGSRAEIRPLLLKLRYVGDVASQRTELQHLRDIVLADDARLIARMGLNGTQYQLNITYEGGLEGDRNSSTEFDTFASYDLALTAVQPYWELSEATVSEARVTDSARVFLDDLAGLPLAESVAIADSVVSNPGDAPVPVVWLLRGPCESAEVSIGGRGFSVPAGLTDSETLMVDPTVSGMPAVVDQSGQSAYSRLAMGPLFPKLPRGESTVHLKMAGAEAGERVMSDQVLATNQVKNPSLRVNRSGWSVDDEDLWGYTAGDPGRLDCSSNLNDRPFLMPNWLYNAKQDFAADAWYPNLKVTFTKGVAKLVMAHTARKVCSVRSLNSTLKWQNPYAEVVGTGYTVESYQSDGDKTFTITLVDKTVSGSLYVVATDEGGEVIHKGECFEAWPMWRHLDDGEIACAIDSIWWAWDDFVLLQQLDGANPLWGQMLDHFRDVVPSLVDVNDFDDWISTNAGTDDPVDLDGSYWVNERAASVVSSLDGCDTAWTGTAGASTSTLSKSGTVLATNLLTDPKITRFTSLNQATGAAASDGDGMVATVGSSPAGAYVRTVESVTLPAGSYVYSCYAKSSGVVRDPYVAAVQSTDGNTIYGQDVTLDISYGYRINIQFTLTTQTNVIVTWHLPQTSGGTLRTKKQMLVTQKDYYRLQSLGVDWFAGDLLSLAASIVRNRSTGAVDVSVPAGTGYVQYGRFNVGGVWAADSVLSVQVAGSTAGFMLLLIDPTGDYDPLTRYTALIPLDGTGGIQNLSVKLSDFMYMDKIVWHHVLLGSWYGIYKDDASVVTDTESADKLGVVLNYTVASWAQIVLNSDKTFSEFPTIRYVSPGKACTLRVKDANGWYWYYPLAASSSILDASPKMKNFTTSGDQANTGTPPSAFTGTFTEITITFTGTGTFTLYGVGDFVSPPVGTTIGNIGLYYDRTPALDFSVYYMRILPKKQVKYSPWVVPYTVNILNGRVNTYRGIPFAGYQAPYFWQDLNVPEGVDMVLGFLSDAQDEYERIHGFRGPFASAYVWDRAGTAYYGEPDTWYEDPWGGYQYRTIDVVCKALKNDPTLTVAAKITTDFIDWIYRVWPSADTAPPDLFNKGVDPVTAGEGPHSVGILMRAMIFAQESGVFDGDARVVTLINRCAQFFTRTYVADQSLDVYGTWSTEPEKETWWQFWNGEILYALAEALDWYKLGISDVDYTDSITTWLDGNLTFLTSFRRSALPNAMNEQYLAPGTFESSNSTLDWTRYIPWQSGVSETQTILLRGVLDVARATGSQDWLDLGLSMSESMMQTLFDLRRTATWSMSKPTTGWPASVISCSIATDSQLMVEFLDTLGALISRQRVQSVSGRAGLQNTPIPNGTATIRIGSQGVSPQGVTQGLLVFGSTASGYFDGNSQYATWQGTANASPSDLHASELEGGSLIQMSFHQRKEIMR